MKRRTYPKPVLDPREEALIGALQKEFEAFTKPGVIARGLTKVGNAVSRVVPQVLKSALSKAQSSASEWEMIQKALEIAEKGFHKLTQQASRMTVSKPGVIEKLAARGPAITTFEEVCLLRSYDIEAVIEDKTYQDMLLAAVEGAATGAFGFAGLPFNLALSFFLYFRAAQSVALHYGYDVKDDPRELQFAAEVTMQSLDPNFSGSGLGGLIGKMMLAAEITALKQALGRQTYTEMAKRGGSALLYVQVRALANKAAKTALEKAGQEGIEAGIFKTLLAQLAKRMPKEAGKKGLPVIGAFLGGLSDAYLMSRILRGAKLIYHKRYLFEKEHRISLLKKPRTPRKSRKKTTTVSKKPILPKRTK
jgi:hypothetical protein